MNLIISSVIRPAFQADKRTLCCALIIIFLSFSAFAETPGPTDPFTRGWNAYQSGEFGVALHYWMPLAEQGDANAQLNIGLMYDAGQGVSVDHHRAADWYRRSAESGLAAAQYNLGLMYLDGYGVEQNSQLANAWLGRAADNGLQDARALLINESPPETNIPDTVPGDFLGHLGGASTGTAWTVADGYAVTSEHVVTGVAAVELYDIAGRRYPATIVLRDDQNDIALLRIDDVAQLPPALPLSHHGSRAGSSVFTLGYPRVDVLGRTPKLSTGIISAINGYQDDPTTYQTSVQIQPGNSGGPLMNMNGEVVGIVAAMLGDSSGSSASQPGLSYAVKVEKLHEILRTLPRRDKTSRTPPGTPAGLADLAARVQNSVLLVVATQ